MRSQYHFPRRTSPRGSCLGSPVFLQRQLCVYTPQPIKYAFSLLSMPFTDFFSTLKQTEIPEAQFNFASPTISLHPPLNYPECPGGWQVRHPSPVEVSPYMSHCITLSNFFFFFYLCPIKLLLNQTLSCFGAIFFILQRIYSSGFPSICSRGLFLYVVYWFCTWHSLQGSTTINGTFFSIFFSFLTSISVQVFVIRLDLISASALKPLLTH